MTDFEAIMKTIRENPDDDTPRLVLADWLEDDGGAGWAEFIRFQVRTASEGRDKFDPELIETEKRLWNTHKDARWCFPFEGDWSWMRRGLMEGVTCTGEQWAKHSASILSPIRYVWYSGAMPLPIQYVQSDCPDGSFVLEASWGEDWDDLNGSGHHRVVVSRRELAGSSFGLLALRAEQLRLECEEAYRKQQWPGVRFVQGLASGIFAWSGHDRTADRDRAGAGDPRGLLGGAASVAGRVR